MKHPYNEENWKSSCLNLLRRATTPHGIKASCTSTTNYGAVFTRDAVMAGIAGLLFDDEKVIDGLRATINMLHRNKGEQGQIASNYKVENDKIVHISFGTLSPKIDSATWYLIGIGLLINKGYEYSVEYVDTTISLLEALEYNGNDLIYIPEGGNWADEYPYEGFILYDQILRAWALRLIGTNFNNPEWIKKAESIIEKFDKQYFNSIKGFYNCSFKPSSINDSFDFAAHTLMGILEDNTTNQFYIKSLDWIEMNFLSKGRLPGAFFPVINNNHPKWNLISNFHLFDFKNKPYHYHNGGIWFIWIGWYAMVLHKYKRHDSLHLLAQMSFSILNKIEDFEFDEYLTGDTYKPKGTKYLCYTSTGILFLCSALKEDSLIGL